MAEVNKEQHLESKRPLGPVAEAWASVGKMIVGATAGYGLAKGVEVFIPEPRVVGFILEIGFGAVGGLIGSEIEIKPLESE